MKNLRWALAALGVLLLFVATWQIQAAEHGLVITALAESALPVTVIAPAGSEPASRPAVLVGHGFSGSNIIMRGFAFTLAKAGYTVVSWDFSGHGANPQPLPSTGMGDRNALVGDAEAALAAAADRGLVNLQQVTILGHSMGSGVALVYGQEHPETVATIAVSPVGQPVTPALPRNLLLMAGTNEANFLENARRRLAEAGGAGGDPLRGTARALTPIQGANHLTILFSSVAHQAAREWLDAAFGLQAGETTYTDRRIGWYFAGVVGTLLAAAALATWFAGRPLALQLRLPLWRRLGALVLGVLGATLLLWLVNLAGLELNRAFGLLVGGFLLIWFGLAGLLGLLLMGGRLEKPTGLALLAGLLTFVLLWLGVGLLGGQVWQTWLLIPPRLVYWPLGALLMLPWFLAAGRALGGTGWLSQLGWWLAQSSLLAGGLLLAMRLMPGIGFLILILPVFPAVFAVHVLACAPYRGGWPFALSGALFTSWMVLAVFPL